MLPSPFSRFPSSASHPLAEVIPPSPSASPDPRPPLEPLDAPASTAVFDAVGGAASPFASLSFPSDDPAAFSPGERFRQVVSILAAGLVRLHRRGLLAAAPASPPS